MTPMIDVVFLLIIFFLCIDFRILEAKLPAYLPKDAGESEIHVDPQEQLRLQIVCDAPGEKTPRPGGGSYHLVGHAVHYRLGATNLRDLDELGAALTRIADDPGRRVRDPAHPERTVPLPVVIEPGPLTVYGDVAPCVDLVAARGFDDIRFGGGTGRTGGAAK